MRFVLLRKGQESDHWAKVVSTFDSLARLINGDFEGDENETRIAKQIMGTVRAGLQSINGLEACESVLLVLEEHMSVEGRGLVQWVDYIPQSSGVPSDVEVAESGYKILLETDGPKNFSSVEARQIAKNSLIGWIKRAKNIDLEMRVEFSSNGVDGSVSSENLQEQKKVGHLAWIGSDKNKFVFVNDQGLRLKELDLQSFAILLYNKSAIVLDSEKIGAVAQGLEKMSHDLHQRMIYESTHDLLTGLLNRKEFEKEIESAISSAKLLQCAHLLVHFDLSQFKVVNSAGGLAAGDQLLKNIAQLLQTESPEGVIIARQSGNEFGLLLLEHSEEKGYRIVDKLLQDILEYRFEWQSDLYHVGASVGLLEINDQSEELKHVLKGLVGCCRKALESGGNRIVSYVLDDLDLKNDSAVALISLVNIAINENKLRLRMQRIEPISAAISNPLPNYEILLSALDGKGNPIPPGEFVSIAERHHRMNIIDQWVVRNTFDWIIQNPNLFKSIGTISINLSGHSLNDEKLLHFLFQELATKKVLKERICFEITETLAVNNLDNAVDFMTEMRNIGCKFSLDDFGSGMSSYTYLKKLPVETLKIDGSFVKNIADDPMDLAIVKSMNDTAHLMGKKTVAEFVSSKEILEKLVETGVDYAQGYYIEEPRWLDEWRPA